MDVKAPDGLGAAAAPPPKPPDAGPERSAESDQKTGMSSQAPSTPVEEKPARTKPEPELDSTQLENLAKLIETAQRNSNQRVGITLDATTKEPVIRITDRTSGKLIRQIPPEEVQRIATKLASLQDGVLVDEDA
jgi:flagellar protein FlaG